MAYTSIQLALEEYRKLFWVENKPWILSGPHKADNYQKETVHAKYEKGGVMVTYYWEHLGHHEKVFSSKFFKKGKIYNHTNGGPIMGTYKEIE